MLALKYVCVCTRPRDAREKKRERNKGVGGRVQWPCSTFMCATANALEQNTSYIVLCKSPPPYLSHTHAAMHTQ
jgi:hypothetical protein